MDGGIRKVYMHNKYIPCHWLIHISASSPNMLLSVNLIQASGFVWFFSRISGGMAFFGSA
jgi:hypothetical protein